MPNLFWVAAAKIRKVSKYVLIVLDSKCLGSLESIVNSEWTIKNSGFMGGFFWWFSPNFGLWCSHKTHRHFAVNYRGFHGFCPTYLRWGNVSVRQSASGVNLAFLSCSGKTWNVWLDALEYHGIMCVYKSIYIYIYVDLCRYMSTIQYLARINIHIHSTDIHWLIQTYGTNWLNVLNQILLRFHAVELGIGWNWANRPRPRVPS